MSNQFRYLVVGMAVLLLAVGPFAWAYQFRRALRAHVAQSIRDFVVAQGNAAAANVPDAEVPVEDFGMELPPGAVTRLWLCDLLAAFWWAWLVFVAVIGYGLFVLMGAMLPAAQSIANPQSSRVE